VAARRASLGSKAAFAEKVVPLAAPQ
jgi:hypothetical protein